MKDNAFEIQIAKPCEVPRSSFLPHEKGSYCLRCEKVVFNFSDLSDDEVIRFFQSPSSQKQTCGIWREDQLKEYGSTLESKSTSGLWSVVFGSVLSFLSVGRISAQMKSSVASGPVSPEIFSMASSPSSQEEKTPSTEHQPDLKAKAGYRTISVKLKLKEFRKGLTPAFLEGYVEETGQSFTADEHGVCSFQVSDSAQGFYTLILRFPAIQTEIKQAIALSHGKKKYLLNVYRFSNCSRFVLGGFRRNRPFPARHPFWFRVFSFFKLHPHRYGR